MRMRGVTWPGGRVSSETHIWNQRPQFAYLLYNFYGATTTIKGSLHGSMHPHCKAVFGQKFSKSRQNRAQKRRFYGNYGV